MNSTFQKLNSKSFDERKVQFIDKLTQDMKFCFERIKHGIAHVKGVFFMSNDMVRLM